MRSRRKYIGMIYLLVSYLFIPLDACSVMESRELTFINPRNYSFYMIFLCFTLMLSLYVANWHLSHYDLRYRDFLLTMLTTILLVSIFILDLLHIVPSTYQKMSVTIFSVKAAMSVLAIIGAYMSFYEKKHMDSLKKEVLAEERPMA